MKLPTTLPRPARHTRHVRATFVLTAALLAACGSADDAVPADGTAADATPAAPSAVTTGLSTPESVLWDAARNAWYVSNINGSPADKDDNGFILRLAADGTPMDSVPFINGTDDDITLHAPKGLALTGDTLWVADIDAVRAFDVATGNAITTIDLASQRATFLNDAATGPDGTVYITDTGIAFDASGNVTHPGASRVFAIKDGRATPAVSLPQGSAPNGIAWDRAQGALLIVGFAGPQVWAWSPGTDSARTLGTGVGGADGLVILGDGRAVYTSWADSSLNAFANGTSTTLRKGLNSPADLGYDPARNLVAVPLFTENRIEFWTVPAAGATNPTP